MSIVAIVFALLAAVGVNPAPAQAATPVQAKVVIIVGPVEGTTSSYRSAADLAYAEAIKHTSDVTGLQPERDLVEVKAAMAASVVVYLGHGNGWPSPYAYDAQYTTKDGFGLNATAAPADRTTSTTRAYIVDSASRRTRS